MYSLSEVRSFCSFVPMTTLSALTAQFYHTDLRSWQSESRFHFSGTGKETKAVWYGCYETSYDRKFYRVELGNSWQFCEFTFKTTDVNLKDVTFSWEKNITNLFKIGSAISWCKRGRFLVIFRGTFLPKLMHLVLGETLDLSSYNGDIWSRV